MITKTIDNSEIYYIEEEGLIANPNLAEYRMIPAVVLNNRNGDKTVENLVKIHLDTPPGDAKTTWCKELSRIFNKEKYWDLLIEFSKPIQCEFRIKFDLKKDYRIIDAIIQSKGLYINYGVKGEKISQKKNGAILIEVPCIDIYGIWEKQLYKILNKKYKKQFPNYNKNLIKEFVDSEIKALRDIINFDKNCS